MAWSCSLGPLVLRQVASCQSPHDVPTTWKMELFFSPSKTNQWRVIHIVFVLVVVVVVVVVVVAKTKQRKPCMEVCYTSHAANLHHLLWLQWNQKTSSYTGCKHPSYCYLLVPKRSTPVHKCMYIYIFYTPTHRATWRGLFWMVHVNWTSRQPGASHTTVKWQSLIRQPYPKIQTNHCEVLCGG